MALRWGRRPVSPFLLAGLAAVSIGAVALAEAGTPRAAGFILERQRLASELMMRGTVAIRNARLQLRPLDVRADPNGTGLIGTGDSLITTSVGDLSVKRTATNPNWGAVMIELLWEAGVRPGDVVAMGFSGSLPGLNLAALAAARALEITPLVITAVGASNWGGNEPVFTWLDMEAALLREEFPVRSLAASVGGARDQGLDLPPGGVELARAAARRHGVRLIAAQTLPENVRARMSLYDRAAPGGRIRAFLNVGGAQANLGACEEPFLISPGLVRSLPPCPPRLEGAAHHFLRRGIPVITVLNVRALALRYGLPIDPVPLPLPGEGGVYRSTRSLRPAVLLVALLLLLGRVAIAQRS